ncbi:tetratricopeptide repeat-containing glycosyltransferase family 2 protein [Paenibacillus sinopodophylli]|uniref:tetratricopeptide repeat-containing glycosyltransferase family 2 protein n=1 Tax=Paenibacillus sinopodophylli TaxID=1837342 RepID=UPI00148753DC|nr:glycosyltransferase [Paenibacillus sinopodophylli]
MSGEGKGCVNLELGKPASGKLPISLCMIVRDEERFLPACLDSAEAYVSEIIIVDTGSSDRTVAIAEHYGAKVVHAAWMDDFAAARNQGLELAALPWILVLDADERLAQCSLTVWEGLLANDGLSGYYVRLCSWIDSAAGQRMQTERAESYMTDAVCRLFRNDPRIRFSGALHEEAATSVAKLGAQRLGYAPLTIWHEGYRAEVVIAKGKRERNGRILKLALERSPDDPMLQYAMGTECFTYGNWSGAAAWLAPLASSLKLEQGYASDLLLKLSYSLQALGKVSEAEEWARRGIEELGFVDFPDLYDAWASALLVQDRNQDALEVLDRALRLGITPAHYSSAPGAGGYRTLYAAGITSERIGEWENAAAYYERSISSYPAFMPAWERLLLLSAVDGRLRGRFMKALNAFVHEGEQQVLQWTGGLLLERIADAGLMQTGDGCRNEDEGLMQAGDSCGNTDRGSVMRKLIDAVCVGEGDPDSLYWRGLLSVQRGRLLEGRTLWERLPEGDGRRAVYLSALELREATAHTDLAPPEQALLRVGAWRAWSAMRAASVSAAALPPLQWCAIIRAPQACRAAQRIALASGSSAPARLAAGVLAAAAADWRAAASSFGAAATDAAAVPWVARAAAAGLAAAFAARARAALSAPEDMALPALQVEAELKLRAVSALFS